MSLAQHNIFCRHSLCLVAITWLCPEDAPSPRASQMFFLALASDSDSTFGGKIGILLYHACCFSVPPSPPTLPPYSLPKLWISCYLSITCYPHCCNYLPHWPSSSLLDGLMAYSSSTLGCLISSSDLPGSKPSF